MPLIKHDMLFASLIVGILSVTVHVFYVPRFTDDSPSLIYCGWLVLADAWLFTDLYSVLQTMLCLFSLSRGFFVGATSLALQQQLSQFLHVLHTQPSSRTF